MRCCRYAARQRKSNAENDEPCFGDRARTLSSLVVDVHNLRFGVKVNHFVPNLAPSVPAVLYASKRHVRVTANPRAVHVDDACLRALGETKNATHIASEYSRREPVSNGISNLNRFVEPLDSNDGYDRTKDLFLGDRHLLLSFKNGGRKEEASSQSALSQLVSAGAKCCPFRSTDVDPLSDSGHRARIDQGSHFYSWLRSRSNFPRPRR